MNQRRCWAAFLSSISVYASTRVRTAVALRGFWGFLWSAVVTRSGVRCNCTALVIISPHKTPFFYAIFEVSRHPSIRQPRMVRPSVLGLTGSAASNNLSFVKSPSTCLSSPQNPRRAIGQRYEFVWPSKLEKDRSSNVSKSKGLPCQPAWQKQKVIPTREFEPRPCRR